MLTRTSAPTPVCGDTASFPDPNGVPIIGIVVAAGADTVTIATPYGTSHTVPTTSCRVHTAPGTRLAQTPQSWSWH